MTTPPKRSCELTTPPKGSCELTTPPKRSCDLTTPPKMLLPAEIGFDPVVYTVDEEGDRFAVLMIRASAADLNNEVEFYTMDGTATGIPLYHITYLIWNCHIIGTSLSKPLTSMFSGKFCLCMCMHIYVYALN